MHRPDSLKEPIREMTVAALGRALFLLQQTSEAEPVGGLVDIYPEKDLSV